MSALRYDVPELVWNHYRVTGIEYEELSELLKEEPNMWIIQANMALKGRPFYIELEEAAYEFIETLHSEGELDG